VHRNSVCGHFKDALKFLIGSFKLARLVSIKYLSIKLNLIKLHVNC